MTNTLITPTMVTREILRLLLNSLVFAKTVNRQYDAQYRFGGAKQGATINVRRPSRYLSATGGDATSTLNDHFESSQALTLIQRHVAVPFSSFEMSLSLQDISERVLKPAVAQLANDIDSDGLLFAKNHTGNLVGTPGTTPATRAVILSAGSRLSQEGTPRNDGMRYLCVNPDTMASMMDTNAGLFHAGTLISDQYRTGQIKEALGFMWGEDQNVAVHTVGPLGGTPLVNGASQGIATGWADFTDLVTDGWTAAAATRLNRGDVITLAGVNMVNPLNRLDQGVLRRFVVSSTTEGNVSSDGSGNATVRVRPAIIRAGQFQNVTASPADNAAITVIGTASTAYPQNIASHRDAFILGTADLDMPDDVSWKARVSDPESGISIRALRQYEVLQDRTVARFDILYAWGVGQREMACRITG